jgi:DNA-binding MarR family transcriptional regulator
MKSLLQYRKSYKIGLLQTKAFRILKQQTNEALKPFNINATDWAVLGLLLEEKNGLQLKWLASELGVKQPYLTRSISKLKELGFISTATSESHTRATNAFITEKGKKFVISTESIIVKKVKPIFSNASPRNLIGYLQTLIAVASVAEEGGVLESLDHMED